MAETVIYDPGANSQANNLLPYALMSGNGFGNGLGGWGGGILGFLAGILFGGFWNGNGFGGFGGGNAASVNGIVGREAIMNAINGTDADVRLLATTLNADVNEVRSAISTLSLAIQNVGSQVGLSGLQVQNAILSGDASIVAKLQECCCENRLLTTQQGYESRIQTIEQTNLLGSQADRNAKSITDAIAAQTVAMNDGFCAIKERELQAKIDSLIATNTSLKSQIDNANQTAQVAAMLAPIQKEVAEIRAAQPNTVPVQWPNLVAVNSTPYVSGGYYPSYPQYGYGNNGIVF